MSTVNFYPIRVLHVIGGMNRGGAENMIMNLYRSIDREQVQFDFLVHTDHQCAYDTEIKSLGGRIFSVPHFNGLNIRRYYNECCTFFAKHPEINVVHGHIGSCAALYLLAAKKYGCFTIAHSHNDMVKHSLRTLIYYMYSYPSRYIADALFGCSRAAGVSRFGRQAVCKKSYYDFHNAVDLEKFSFAEDKRGAARKLFGISSDELVIGTVARIEAQKNPEFLLSVFLEILDMCPSAKCLWVGGGRQEAFYRQKIVSAGMQDRIIMTGPRDDVPLILQGFDCFVLPSFYEGLPVSAIEAQAAGLECVLSDTITREARVSHLVSYESLESSARQWAELCLEKARCCHKSRTSPTDEIRAHGYDIVDTTKWLCDFYLRNGFAK